MEQLARTSKQIGAAIRRHRRGARLSQADLGTRAGLRQATISAVENGEPGTRLDTLMDLMAALGLEMVIRARSTAAGRVEDLF